MTVMEKEDKYLMGQIEDKISQAEAGYMVTSTGFLDPHSHSLAERVCKSTGTAGITKVFTGGYEEAERVIMVCLPDYADLAETEEELLMVIEAKSKPGSRQLRHGDYLGSLTGLGLDRSVIGDILVRPDGADIIVLREIAEFLMTNYAKAGKSELTLREKSIRELIIPEGTKTEQSDTVASLRLDNIVASAFGLSRANAQEAIRRGIVFVNSREVLKTDSPVEEGDRIVLRGKGRVAIKEIGGTSRKGRIYVRFIIWS